MDSQWTNKYSIMRDLSMVQGCVPADIKDTLTSGDKPPTVNLTEETEEEFFRNCTGEGDIAAPDLGLIRQMLDMVREIDESSDTDVENLKKVIQISKLNPMTPEFVPQNLDHPSPKPEKAPDKSPNKMKSKKQNRNVALTSILELSGSIVEKGNEPKRLINSVDISPSVTASVKKVNGWLEAQQKLDTRGPEKMLTLDPGSKKKISPVKESDKSAHTLKHTKLIKSTPKDILSLDPSTMFRKKVTPKVVPVLECNKVISPQGCGNYVPSSNADEYYKKYLERNKAHAMVCENVWSRAERQMKEIDERRRKEAELFQQSYIAAQLTLSPQSAQSPMSEPSGISTQTYTISTERASILNESPAIMSTSPGLLSDSSTILSGSPAILNESPAISHAPSATKPMQPPWNLTAAEEERLAVVRLPHHRHILTADCTVCRVRQESQDDKVIYVIDADDRRLIKSKHKYDSDEILSKTGGPTWRNDENLKEWRYDDETNSWHKSDEVPKPREKKEKEPKSSRNNNGEVQFSIKNNGNIQESENSDMDNISNNNQDVSRNNNELQLYSPESGVTYIEGTVGNNELDYYSVEILEAVSQ